MSQVNERAEENNCFDLIRLALAVLVVYSHASLLGGFGEETFSRLVHGQTIAGTLAVLGFFGLSGYLVTRSFVQRNDWKRFLRARGLRILPGYYLALLFSAFVAAPLIASQKVAGPRWELLQALEYFGRNAGVRVGAWHVGGIPSGLNYNGSINGALWSLFPEVCCYGLVLLLGVLGWLQGASGRLQVLLLTVAVGLAHAALVINPNIEHLAPSLLQLTGSTPFVTSFLVGSTIYCFRDRLALGRASAAGWLLASAVTLKFGGWALLGPLIFPLALISLAYSFSFRLRHDLSYGTYIFHYPIMQTLSAFGGFALGYWSFLGVSLGATIGLAALSWFWVERPCLSRKTG